MKTLFYIFLMTFTVSCLHSQALKKRNVAIFIYQGVEILDFGGPSEVFASASTDSGFAFNVYTVAATADPILSQRFITVVPQYTIDNCPQPDIIVFPGGSTKSSVENPRVIEWVQNAAKNSTILMSVCTGAFILNKAGLLEGKEATTWYGQIDNLIKAAPKTKVHRNTRYVDNGQIITTAGVSAGIDGALHLVERLLGRDVAAGTAKYMEYDKWKPNEGLVVQK